MSSRQRMRPSATAAPIVREEGRVVLGGEFVIDSSPRIPESYEGVSGGALCELLGQKVDFRQSEDNSVVTCNAGTAIDKLVEDVVARWNNQAI